MKIDEKLDENFHLDGRVGGFFHVRFHVCFWGPGLVQTLGDLKSAIRPEVSGH
jgi:hypothetical protein